MWLGGDFLNPNRALIPEHPTFYLISALVIGFKMICGARNCQFCVWSVYACRLFVKGPQLHAEVKARFGSTFKEEQEGSRVPSHRFRCSGVRRASITLYGSHPFPSAFKFKMRWSKPPRLRVPHLQYRSKKRGWRM
jgi:hypothetical protein